MLRSAQSNDPKTASDIPESQPPQTIDVEDTKPLTKKKTGRDSPFTDAQLAHIDSFFPAFEQLLRKHKLHLGKAGKEHDPSEVSDWINKTVEQIQKSGEFKGKLDATLKTPKQWKTVCFSMHINELY